MMKLIKCLIDKDSSCLPVWFMRQAGRHLPEFKKIRALNPNFIKLCLDSDLSSEITLQPISRYDLDAAVIFSDILMVPYSLGQGVTFEKNHGPKLSNFILKNFEEITEIDFIKKLKPVYKGIEKTRKKLDKKKSLIGFVGAPWTLIVYMFGLKKAKNVLELDSFKKKEKEINLILKKLSSFLCLHIKNQIKAGADVIQIFDSWAGLLPDKYLDNYCYQPNHYIVSFCKNNRIPVICFPKGIKKKYANFYKEVQPDGLNIDFDLNPEWARKNLEGACIQGGMDPKILLLENKKIFNQAEKYLKIFKDYPYIFNLGHGLLPETDPDKVERLINFVREH